MTSIAFIGNVTSMSYLIGKELMERGYEVDIVGGSSIFQTNKFKGHESEIKKPSLLHRAIRKYATPVYQQTLNRKEYDIEIRSFSKSIVKAKYKTIAYHGNDLRDYLWARWDEQIHYPCFYSTKDLGLRYLREDKIRFGEAVWFPRCFVTEYFNPEQRVPFDGENLTIGFFPTDPKMEEKGWRGKGTQLLYDAVEVLKSEGYAVKLLTPVLMGHVSHDKMNELYKQCHVVADQFNPDVGMYGVISMEAIMMNRPPVCYVRDAHWEYDEMKSQITNCEPNPDSIAKALVEAINKPVNPKVVERCYNPQLSANAIEQGLRRWGFA